MPRTKEQISYNMSCIRGRDTKIEILLRKELWQRGLRYRKNVKDVIGKPDIVFKGKKIAVFCDSEFWHGRNLKKEKKRIKSNRDFWIPKIERNIKRDKEVNKELKRQGWTILRFWGDHIKKNTMECADVVEREVSKKL